MKQFTIALGLLFFGYAAQAQACGARFPMVFTHLYNAGVGMEVGMYPNTIQRWGYFVAAGIGNTRPLSKIGTGDGGSLNFYAKTQYRINEWMGATAMVGVEDFDRGIMGLGLRVHVAEGAKRKHAFIIEPMTTTKGFRMNAGIGIAL